MKDNNDKPMHLLLKVYNSETSFTQLINERKTSRFENTERGLLFEIELSSMLSGKGPPIKA